MKLVIIMQHLFGLREVYYYFGIRFFSTKLLKEKGVFWATWLGAFLPWEVDQEKIVQRNLVKCFLFKEIASPHLLRTICLRKLPRNPHLIFHIFMEENEDLIKKKKNLRPLGWKGILTIAPQFFYKKGVQYWNLKWTPQFKYN